MLNNYLVSMPSNCPLNDPGSLIRRFVRLVALVALALALAGCSGILADNPELPAPEEAADQYESLDAFSASYTAERTTSNGTERWDGRIVVRPGTSDIYQNVSHNGGAPILFVSNGSVRWIYDTDAESVTRVNVTGDASPRQQRIQHLVAQVTDDGNGSVEPGIPTAPVVPPGKPTPTEQLNASVMQSRYEGIVEHGQRKAHVIVVETTADADTEYRQVTYLDTEWFVPLKGESEMAVDGQRYRSEYRLDNITFNPAVSDDRFEFEPPADTATNTTHLDRTRFETREALVETAEMTVPAPDVPQRFELQGARRTVSGNTTTVSLRYSSAAAGLYVGKRNTDTGNVSQLEDGKPVDIGNQTGTYRQVGANGILQWSCGESAYTVSGELPKEKLLDVAASIECE